MRIKTNIIISCKFCGKDFRIQTHRLGRAKFCSSKCRQVGIFTLEVRNKLSKTRKGRPTGKTGDKCHFWKGGVTEINKQLRTSMEYRLWREAVFTRDNYTCTWCLKKGGKLHADHIKSFSKYPTLRLAIDNGRTLCILCHQKTDTYGGKSNKKDYE